MNSVPQHHDDREYTHVSQMPADVLFEHAFPELLEKHKDKGELMLIDIVMECWKYEERGKAIPLIFRIVDYFVKHRDNEGHDRILARFNRRLRHGGNKLISTYFDICRAKDDPAECNKASYFWSVMEDYIYLDENELSPEKKVKLLYFKKYGELLSPHEIQMMVNKDDLVQSLQE